jgi:ketosteroid isomerase-like protein
MTNFDGEAFVHRFMTVWNNHDVNGIMSMFTDDAVFEPSVGPEPWGERAVGREAAGRLAAAFFDRMPDARYEKLRHFASPEIAVVESRTTGTRAGAPYDVHLVDVLTLRDGKIATKRSYRKVRL